MSSETRILAHLTKTLRIPMWGYEPSATNIIAYADKLRIPMWGYEDENKSERYAVIAVTNPHVGL